MDSFVIQTNVHFPTDINLTWDCARKCLDMIDHITNQIGDLPGWRERRSIRKKLKRQYHKTAEIHRKKGKDFTKRIEVAVLKYLDMCTSIVKKVSLTLTDKSINHNLRSAILIQELARFKALLVKHIDLTYRRIIEKEKIPHDEKIFSIFEPHTQWLNKGKLHKKVELGLNTQIATDENHFILYHYVMESEVDVQTSVSTANAISEKYGDIAQMSSISFDRNYYSLLGKQKIEGIFQKVIMPKPGKKSAKQSIEEAHPDYQTLRTKHSTIEANINQLEHNGLQKCRDKGILGFKKYVALGVLAYNLHRLGKIILSSKT